MRAQKSTVMRTVIVDGIDEFALALHENGHVLKQLRKLD
jgi:hypothetical protein